MVALAYGKLTLTESDGYLRPGISSTAGTVVILRASNGQEITRINQDCFVDTVAFIDDGKHVVSGCWDGPTRTWEIGSGRETAQLNGNCSDLLNSNPKEDNFVVVACSSSNSIDVWDVVKGSRLSTMSLEKLIDYVTTVKFSPDGKSIATGDKDRTIRIRDTVSGQQVVRMFDDDIVTSVAFSPDGKFVASGSLDNTARVWNVSNGEEVARMTHSSSVDVVSFALAMGSMWYQEGEMGRYVFGFGTLKI